MGAAELVYDSTQGMCAWDWNSVISLQSQLLHTNAYNESAQMWLVCMPTIPSFMEICKM
jgi:hypothetical protein